MAERKADDAGGPMPYCRDGAASRAVPGLTEGAPSSAGPAPPRHVCEESGGSQPGKGPSDVWGRGPECRVCVPPEVVAKMGILDGQLVRSEG
jgi:hypothetical protein